MSDESKRVAVGTSNGVMVFRWKGEGDPWHLEMHGLTGHPVASLCQGVEGLYAGTVDSMVHYTQDGERWRPLFEGFQSPAIHSLVVDRNQPHKIFAGTSPANVYHSQDGGMKWGRLTGFNQAPTSDQWSHPEPPYTPLVSSLFLHPADSNVIFASVASGGLVASLDGGHNWVDRRNGLPRQIRQVVCPTANPGRLYVATNLGFYRSDDLGQSWTLHNSGLPWVDSQCLAVDPGNADHILLGSNRPQGGGTIFRSRNGGLNWEVAAATLPASANSNISVLASSDGIFYAGTDGGHIYFSADTTNWNPVRPPLAEIHCVLPFG